MTSKTKSSMNGNFHRRDHPINWNKSIGFSHIQITKIGKDSAPRLHWTFLTFLAYVYQYIPLNSKNIMGKRIKKNLKIYPRFLKLFHDHLTYQLLRTPCFSSVPYRYPHWQLLGSRWGPNYQSQFRSAHHFLFSIVSKASKACQLLIAALVLLLLLVLVKRHFNCTKNIHFMPGKLSWIPADCLGVNRRCCSSEACRVDQPIIKTIN